nr:hypothetical protein [Bacillus albus]
METFKQQLPLFTTIGGLISGFILSLGLGLVNSKLHQVTLLCI